MPEAQATRPLGHAAEKGGFKEEVFAALEAAVQADVDAFLRRGRVNAQDFENLERTIHRRALDAADRVIQAAGAQRSQPLWRPKSMRSSDRGTWRRRTSRPSRRHCVAKPSASPRRWRPSGSTRTTATGWVRPWRARAAGRRSTSAPPEDVHHADGPDEAGTGLLLLPRLPSGKLSARPGPGLARHLAVTGRHPAGGHDGGRGELRQGERVVGGSGRGGGRDPAGRALRRGARPRNRP